MLNLNTNGSVRGYMTSVCNGLGLSLTENVYATNLFKNFFVQPPTQIRAIDIFSEFAPAWLPFLLDELSEFPDIPLITLGEPILAPLVGNGVSNQVRHYWGYVSNWQNGSSDAVSAPELRRNSPGANRLPVPAPASASYQILRREDEGLRCLHEGRGVRVDNGSLFPATLLKHAGRRHDN